MKGRLVLSYLFPLMATRVTHAGPRVTASRQRTEKMVKVVAEPVIVRLITDGLVELGGCRGDLQGKTELPQECRELVGLLGVQALSNGSQWLCWMGSWRAQNGGVLGILAQ